jgi:hypothetical protein
MLSLLNPEPVRPAWRENSFALVGVHGEDLSPEQRLQFEAEAVALYERVAHQPVARLVAVTR